MHCMGQLCVGPAEFPIGKVGAQRALVCFEIGNGFAYPRKPLRQGIPSR